MVGNMICLRSVFLFVCGDALGAPSVLRNTTRYLHVNNTIEYSCHTEFHAMLNSTDLVSIFITIRPSVTTSCDMAHTV